MKIKFLQLNMQGGVLVDEVLSYIEKNNIDIVNFQEVTGNSLSTNNIDCFEYLKSKLLPLSYQGEVAKTWNIIGEENSYFGNATFFKNFFTLKSKDIVWMKDFAQIRGFFKEKPEDIPRNALFLLLESEGKQFQIINTHLAWGKTAEDKPYKIRQAEALYTHISAIKQPFIFSGDFNLTPDSKVVKMFQNIGRDLTSENKINNTLNLNIHYARKRIPLPGYAVDYIFVENGITVNSFKLINDIDLSDHYGLLTEVEL